MWASPVWRVGAYNFLHTPITLPTQPAFALYPPLDPYPSPMYATHTPWGGVSLAEDLEMLPEVKQDSLKRLNYIEGHLAGIRRMIEDEKYCVDILKQTFAVRRAIQKVESKLLEGHLHTHVLEGVRNGHDQDVLDELIQLYNLSEK